MTQLYLDLRSRSDMTPIWTFGGNVPLAPLLLRKDVQRHLQICREELGLRHVRCHGMLAEPMVQAREDGSFDFANLEKALDAILDSSLVPFFGVSGMPRAIARDPQAAGLGGRCNGPPREWNRWYDLVRAVSGMVDSRFGGDAAEWYFEVGHGGEGPDPPSWGGTREEYFKLYDIAAQAIKEVRPEYRVGGPAVPLTPDGDWLDGFLSHVTQPSADFPLGLGRCDFVTVYPPAAANAPVDGQNPVAAREAFLEARRKMTDLLGAGVPLVCAGWGRPASGTSAAGIAADASADFRTAAAMCQAMAEWSEVVQGAMFWNLSDIDDPDHPRFEPFHGGPGLLTVNDVRKSSFNALRLLGDHRGYHCQRVGAEWIDPIPGLGCLASVEEYTLRLLAWYQPYHPGPDAAAGTTARFTIAGLSETVHVAQVEVIRAGAGSPYETWVEMGRPPFVNRQILDKLEIASHPATAEVDFREYPPRLEPGMVLQLTIPLPFDEHYSD